MESDLFNRLPTGLFRPLASQRQRLYWRVLVRLYGTLFDEETEVSEYGHRRDSVIETVVTVLEQHPSLWIDDQADVIEDGSLRGRANFTYNTLRNAGWLDEERRGYNDYVSMPPRVNQCLNALIEIAEGRALVMTGKLKSIQAGMREVLANPADQADTLTELAKEAGRFSRHLNSIRGAIKGLYDQIRGDIPAREIVAKFFDNFLREIFIRDYATIKTTENPLTIRDELLGIVSKLRYKNDVKELLINGYRKIYIDQDADECASYLDRDISRLEQVFHNIERQLDAIDSMKVRYEQRVDTVIEYATRSPKTIGRDLKRLTHALVRHDEKTPISSGVHLPFLWPEPYGESRLAIARQPRQSPAPRVVQQHTVSNKLRERTQQERTALRAIHINDNALQDFLNARLGNRRTEETAGLIVRNIHDYFCVLNLQRAARSPESAQKMFPGVMSHYVLSPTDDWVESTYFLMRNVIITRREPT